MPYIFFCRQISALDPEVIKMATICLMSCLVLRAVATYFVSFGCGLNSKEKIFIGLTWTAKATVQVYRFFKSFIYWDTLKFFLQ